MTRCRIGFYSRVSSKLIEKIMTSGCVTNRTNYCEPAFVVWIFTFTIARSIHRYLLYYCYYTLGLFIWGGNVFFGGGGGGEGVRDMFEGIPRLSHLLAINKTGRSYQYIKYMVTIARMENDPIEREFYFCKSPLPLSILYV